MSGKRVYGGVSKTRLREGISRYNRAGISTRQLEATLLACGVTARLRDYAQGDSRPSLTMLVLWVHLFDWDRHLIDAPIYVGRCPSPIRRIREQLQDLEREARS